MSLRSKSECGFGYAMILIATLAVSAPAGAVPFSDFDDGTLQGWTRVEPFGGSLYAEPTGGNPGGYLVGSDTIGDGGGLLTAGPDEFSGDLSVYTGVSYDEFVVNHGPHNIWAARPVLLGPNDTRYRYDVPFGLTNQWVSSFVAFEETGWTLISGSESFETVLQNGRLGMELEGSVAASGPEICLDNVMLVPEPATLALVLIGGWAAIRRPRR